MTILTTLTRFISFAKHSMCFLPSFGTPASPSCVPNPRQVNWKKIAGRPPNHLLEVVTKLDEQVQSGTAQNAAVQQKGSKVTEAAKVRRKRHYRLESEEKPTFPFQQKNFYNHVMENKEVVKTLSQMSTCTQNIKTVSINFYVIFS